MSNMSEIDGQFRATEKCIESLYGLVKNEEEYSNTCRENDRKRLTKVEQSIELILGTLEILLGRDNGETNR